MDLGAHLDRDLRQLARYRDGGADLAAPREVQHVAYFRSRRAAARVARDLAARDHHTAVRKVAWRWWELRAATITALDTDTVEAFTRAVYALVVWGGGYYEGWVAADLP